MEKSNNFLLPDSCPEDYLQEYGGAKPEDCSLIVSRCKDVIPEIGDAVHLGFYLRRLINLGFWLNVAIPIFFIIFDHFYYNVFFPQVCAACCNGRAGECGDVDSHTIAVPNPVQLVKISCRYHYTFFFFFNLFLCAFFSTSGRFVHDCTYYMPVSLAVVTPSMGWHFCEDAVCKQQHPPSLN